MVYLLYQYGNDISIISAWQRNIYYISMTIVYLSYQYAISQKMLKIYILDMSSEITDYSCISQSVKGNKLVIHGFYYQHRLAVRVDHGLGNASPQIKRLFLSLFKLRFSLLVFRTQDSTITSSNGNIWWGGGGWVGWGGVGGGGGVGWGVTGEFPPQRPVTRSFDIFFDLRLDKQLRKPSRRRCFGTPLRSLWRHCYGVNDK